MPEAFIISSNRTIAQRKMNLTVVGGEFFRLSDSELLVCLELRSQPYRLLCLKLHVGQNNEYEKPDFGSV
jgi:hypothetical protein